MDIFWVGVVGIIIFYLVVLGVGIWAGIKYKGHSEVETMNAGRRMGYVVGTISLIGTWAGGAFINGTAEKMYSSGLLNVQVPLGYSISLVAGALLFLKKMRDGNFITLLDPFQEKYGIRYGALLIIPAITSELFWCAAVFNSLGNALEVVLGIGPTVSIIISAVFAGLYTLFGGMASITYTDVIQLVFIVFGLVLSVPFAYYNSAANHSNVNDLYIWFGSFELKLLPSYIDIMLLLIFGGIPWQGYCQRIFSIRSSKLALRMSWISSFGVILMALPPVLIGLTARITDWKATDYKGDPTKDATMILPLTLRYLCPPAVTFFGLGAVTGAVMSSADSALLATGAMFARNIYKQVFKPKASDKEIHWVLRVSIAVVTVLATVTSLTIKSVYYLSYMCSDIVYVVLFPQLLLVIYFPKNTNAYGSVACYLSGFLLRLLAGEPGLGLPAVTKYPWYDEESKEQLFPFRTLIMLLTTSLFFIVSAITDLIFIKGKLNHRFDIMGVYKEKTEEPPQQPAPTQS